MAPALALLFALAASPGFMRPVDARIRTTEETDELVLADLCRVPGAQLELRTRSNMLTTGAVEALRRCAHPLVELRLPILGVHRERLEKVPGAEPLVELSSQAPLTWAALSSLGPRRIHIRVAGELTAERAALLARMRDVEVELDLRGRVPDAEELARFRALDRASRSVRLAADAPVELVAGLAALHLDSVVVETSRNHLAPALLDALDPLDARIRVALRWPFSAADVAPLARLRRVALEIELGPVDRVPRGLTAALAPLEPSSEKPAPQRPGPEPLH